MPDLKWTLKYEINLLLLKPSLKSPGPGNNHSTCWVVQVAAFASLVHKQEALVRDWPLTDLNTMICGKPSIPILRLRKWSGISRSVRGIQTLWPG
jgi:hypothetical protein